MWRKKKEIDDLHEYLKNSFQNFKQDNQNIIQWINHLHQKNQEQERALQDLQQKNQHHEWHLHQLRNQPQTNPEYYNYLHQRIEQLNQKVDQVIENHNSHAQRFDHHNQKLETIHQRLEALEKPKNTSSFKEKMVQTFSRHSKSYLKNMIFNYLVQHQKISALQLKDIVVDQQGLASKSSFYRILAEVEKSEQVTVIKDGKQKIFLLKSTPNQ